jgi:hypothetical protein
VKLLQQRRDEDAEGVLGAVGDEQNDERARDDEPAAEDAVASAQRAWAWVQPQAIA